MRFGCTSSIISACASILQSSRYVTIQRNYCRTLLQRDPESRHCHSVKEAPTQRNNCTSLQFLKFQTESWTEERQRDALEKFGREQLGVKHLNDWYSITSANIAHMKRQLKFIQSKYNGSLWNALKKLYPQHNWDPLQFPTVPHGYYNSEDAQRRALETLGRVKFGVRQLDDWYNVSSADVTSELSFIKKHYNGSLFTALKKLYPQHEWNFSLVSTVPRRYWCSEAAQRSALERLGREKFGVKELDDWYNVKAQDVYNELSFIKNYYNGSLFNALKKLYPQHEWNSLRFMKLPHKYWDDETAQREALERFGREQLGVKELDDWYSVKAANLSDELGFVYRRHGSLIKALQNLYPQHNWDPLRFVSKHKWKDEAVQRAALEGFGRELGVKELDDWYSVRTTDIPSNLSFVHNIYGSLFNALKKLYPEHDWDPLRATIPRNYWNDETAQRETLAKFGREKLGVKTLDDWYSVKATEVHSELRFIHAHYGSLFNALKKLYPQHNWDPLRFSRVPSRTWIDENTQRDALERLGREQLGVKELDDWYSVTALDVHNELSFVTTYYNGSLYAALKKLYPQHVWDPLRFHRIPYKYWKQENTVKHYHNMFMNWKVSHNIQSVADWYQLPPEQVHVFKKAAKGIFGSITKMLAEWFPDTAFRSQYISQVELQNLLKHVIAEADGRLKIVYSSTDINSSTNVMVRKQLTPENNQWQELDRCIRELNRYHT